ncbi:MULTISPECIES: TAXI family TRAP transporter solute-binding subunit [Bacillaceae]|uniref:C4-dicarboxylate ABC transporter substrate-binding protein n=1 Tax=Alkalicoccobacillus plakortidis TaxID=444060 RepID=A0A9D5DPF2_9BACI|nr:MULTISPECIES: TAXI family TRAP transporter solute-binding subunit [Bacillaceae]KQL56096.1 C4-dicarboxylate ABC transporter substrate-binding protein [Alkalicoccobacillus plakortidis]
MKKSLPYLVAFSAILALGACGNDDSNDNGGDDAGGDEPQFMNLLTGGTGGTYYPLGGEIANILGDATDTTIDAQSSNASADNLMSLSDDNAEIAFTQTDVMSNAIDGINAFEGEAIDNISAIGSLYPETIQIVTTAGSGIETIEDLEGKAISVGAPGSGTYLNAEQILDVAGLTMDDINAQHLSFDESTSGLQDGNIDAAFITAGTPTGAVEGLSATNDIAIVSMTDEQVNSLVDEFPFYAPFTIESGTYAGLDSEVNTVAVYAMLAVTNNLSEDLVYEMTKALYERTDEMSHEKSNEILLETAQEGIGFDIHPGAQRFFDEQ